MERLANDPVYQAKRREQQARAAEIEGGSPAAAVPVLLAALDRPHHPRTWEALVRSLGVKAARESALERFRDLYRAERDADRRWVIANSLGGMARFRDVEDLEGIAEYRALFRPTYKPAHLRPAL